MIRSAMLLSLAAVLVACQTTAPLPYTTSPALTPAEHILLAGSQWNRVDWSPDGQRLVLINPNSLPPELETPGVPPATDGPIVIVEVASGEQTEIPQQGIDALWSADSQSLLISSAGDQGDDRRLWLYWLADHRLQPVPAPGGRPQVWTGDRLLYESLEGLSSVAVMSGDPITLGDPQLVARYHLEQSDSQWIYPAPDLKTFLIQASFGQTANGPTARWWLDSADGASNELNASIGGIGTCCAWSPDSELLAVFVDDPERTLSIIYRASGIVRHILRGSEIGEGDFISMDFSPSGKFIAFEWSAAGEGFPFSNTQAYLVNVETGAWHKVTSGPGPYRWVDWSPTNNVIAYLNQSGEVGLLRVDAP